MSAKDKSKPDYQYWYREDWDTDKPRALLRYRGGYMTTWNSKEQQWRPSVRSVPELDGLGGATDFRSIDAESAGRVKEYLDRSLPGRKLGPSPPTAQSV